MDGSASTAYVFIDTSTFEAEGFGFSISTGLRLLLAAVDDGRAKVLISTVTDQEVRRRIEERITKAMLQAKKNYELRGLRLHDFEALRRIPPADAVGDVVNQWKEYCARLKPIMIDVDTVKPSRVMEAFFEKKPPFSAKKPGEFRDAFVLEALRSWADASQVQVLVVSSDTDFERACDGERLVHLKTLEDVISRVSYSADRAKIEASARGVIEGQGESLQWLLQDELPSLVSLARDYEGDVSFIGLYRATPKTDSFKVIELARDHILVSGVIDARFEIEVDSLDEARASWTLDAHQEVSVVLEMPLEGTPRVPGPATSLRIEHPKRIILSSDDVTMSSHQSGGSGSRPERN